MKVSLQFNCFCEGSTEKHNVTFSVQSQENETLSVILSISPRCNEEDVCLQRHADTE